MPFQTYWIDEPYIMVTEYVGRIHAGDIEMNMLELSGIIQYQPVYVALDFARAEAVPVRFFELSSPSQIISHPNTRWFVVVNPKNDTSRTTRLLTGDKVKVFNDRKSAVAFLRGMVRLDADALT